MPLRSRSPSASSRLKRCWTRRLGWSFWPLILWQLGCGLSPPRARSRQRAGIVTFSPRRAENPRERPRDRAPGSDAAVLDEVAPVQTPAAGTRLVADPVWRSGSGLVAPPSIGRDGALYVASRQGSLDVLEATGELRFSISIGGTPTGAMVMDPRGWLYVGLATGRILAVDPEGRRQWVFASPRGIRGDLQFSEVQGLLFRNERGQILGVNRSGYVLSRLDPEGRLSAGPVALFDWCVVATAEGELIWGNRWGKRRHVAVGAPIDELRGTVDGGVWARTQDGLIAFSKSRNELFRLDGVRAMATCEGRAVANSIQGTSKSQNEPSRSDGLRVMVQGEARVGAANSIEGGVVTEMNELIWLDSQGVSLHRTRLALGDSRGPSLEMVIEPDGVVWLVLPSRLERWHPTGQRLADYDFPGRRLLRPVIDVARQQSWVASLDGEIFRVTW